MTEPEKLKKEPGEESSDSPEKTTGASTSMMDAWLETQKLLWDSWINLFGVKPVEESETKTTNPYELWQKMIQDSFEVWSEGAVSIARSTAEQFLSAQDAAMRLMEFTAKAWDVMDPKMASGGSVLEDLGGMIEQFQENWLKLPETMAAATQDLNQMWELYLKYWGSFGQPWNAALHKMPEFMGRAISGDTTALVGVSNLYQQAYQDSLARLVTSPSLGLTRELNEKFQLGFDAWVSWQLATLEYQGVVHKIWEQAFEKYFQDLLSLADEGETIESIRDLVLLWTRGAEDIFTEYFRKEEYVLAQGKMLNAAMVYRKRERSIIETFFNLYDLPTRSELDEAHRRIYELKKELKVLQKTLAEIQALQNGGAV